MAGRAGRTYKRDGNGRFASTGGGGSKRPAAKRVAKGPNRLTRDNSGKITSVGGDGATVRGGRLRTAGGKLRARQVTSLKGGGGRLKGGKSGIQTESTSKTYGRGVDSAKVGRIMQRVAASKNYQGSKRVRFAKGAAGLKTAERAADFLHKLGGYKKGGSSMGRSRWETPAGLTVDKAVQNIAREIPKQPRRSTAKIGNKKRETRADKRAKELASRESVKASVFYQRTQPSARPGGLKRLYDGSTGRGLRSTGSAANRQSSRRKVIQTLRGTGASLSPAARISRGRARQAVIGGGTTSTFGKVRRS